MMTRQILLFASCFKTPPPFGPVQIGQTYVLTSDSDRNMGVIMDSKLTGEQQTTNTAQSVFHQLRKLGHIMKYLTQGATETLIYAFVSSRLDYCNSPLYGVGLHDYLIAKLPYAQNAAARVVTKAKLRTKITPVLQSRHWLPITERTHFKVLLLTYKAVHGSSISTGAGNQTCSFPQTEIWYCCSPTRQFMAPAYLQELVTKHAPSRRLRSGTAAHLQGSSWLQHIYRSW